MIQGLGVKRTISIGLVGLALASATAGCADDGFLPALDAPASADLALRDVSDGHRRPLVRVHKGADHLVSFYRAPNGEILIAQLGRGAPSPAALPTDPVAAFRQLAPDEPVPEALMPSAAHLDTALAGPEAQVAPVTVHAAPEVLPKGVFPWRDFKCWARDRLHCLYDQTQPLRFRYPNGGFSSTHTYNAVWAVDAGSVRVGINFDFGLTTGQPVDYSWDTHEGEWRAIQQVGTRATWTEVALTFGAANYHFSDATGEQ